MAITFSFKEKRKIEQEKYDYPVLTQRAYDTEKKGTVAKFAMNKAMLSALGYPADLKDCKISVARDEDTNEIILLNSTGVETPNQANMVSDGSFNSKFLLGRLKKAFPELNVGVENEFDIIRIEREGSEIYARIVDPAISIVEDDYAPEPYPEEEFLPEADNMLGKVINHMGEEFDLVPFEDNTMGMVIEDSSYQQF